mmetsp:Transcript_4823/g.7310  ORF Transcript_4823/g.7310 Transcript_4823/m.7310 type:complete len:172 (-) Transcript_4823:70-585(-)
MPAPRQGCFLSFFYFLNLVSVIVALLVAISLVLVLALSKDISIVEIITRLYGIVFCFVIVFAELEWPLALRETLIFKLWPIRGALYIFLGLLTLEFSDFSDDNDLAKVFHNIIGWIMVGIGAFYFVLGVTCMRRVREKKLAQYQAVVNAHIAMEDAMAQQSTRSMQGDSKA